MNNADVQLNPLLRTLRWLAVIPAALLASWLTWIAVYWGNRLIMDFNFTNPSSFLGKIFLESLSGFAMGAALVYVGCYVAPSHRKQTAIVLGGLALVAVGVMLYPAIILKDDWAIFSSGCLVLGAGFTTHSVLVDETKHLFAKSGA